MTVTQERSMWNPRRTDERGMALAVAIFALVVIGALVAGAFYASTLEQRTGRNAMKYTMSATRLNDQLFLLTSQGSRVDPSGSELARSSVATMARLSFVSATAKAAVTVTKPVKFNGNSFSVIGNDSMPKGWDKDSLGNADPNCATGADQAGVRSASQTGAASADQDNLFGAPKEVANDPTVTNDFFNIFGDVTFDELKKNADIVVSATTPQHPAPTLLAAAPFRCNVGDWNNWGEPERTAGYIKACSTYYPIIYASGSQLKMSGGARGQGLLLIEGDLEITGNFEFSGLIVAKGGIKINGTGNKITGALLAQDVDISDK